MQGDPQVGLVDVFSVTIRVEEGAAIGNRRRVPQAQLERPITAPAQRVGFALARSPKRVNSARCAVPRGEHVDWFCRKG